MTQWKYTDSSNRIVSRMLDDGRVESCLAEALDADTLATVLSADPPAPPDPRDQIAYQTELALRSGLGYELVELAMRSYMEWVHKQPGGADITEAQLIDPASPYYSIGYAKNKETRDTLLALVQSK